MTPFNADQGLISAIIPARNEEAVIAICVESLAPQKEVAEIFVVNDQSTDRTAEVVRGLVQKYSQVKLLETTELPSGWVGKNNAVWLGARQAKGQWLLFTDADTVHEPNSAAKTLDIAKQREAAVVSFSPGQIMQTWQEKALIPYAYCRLARHFSYQEVNDPQSEAAAANGQFLLIRRDAYEAVGGHAGVAGNILEDVALARGLKRAGYRLWFASGRGIVRARMYRAFGAMWEGWRKNLYPLMGGSPEAVRKEMAAALGPLLATLLATVAIWGLSESTVKASSVLAMGLLAILIAFNRELRTNQFPPKLMWYGIPGRLLYAGVLWASYRSHVKGKLEWKGREYPVTTPGASKG
jgi:hypothetical protein